MLSGLVAALCLVPTHMAQKTRREKITGRTALRPAFPISRGMASSGTSQGLGGGSGGTGTQPCSDQESSPESPKRAGGIGEAQLGH